jgi:hypothetical protein
VRKKNYQHFYEIDSRRVAAAAAMVVVAVGERTASKLIAIQCEY